MALKAYGQGARLLKVKLAAAHAGVQIECPAFTFGVTNKTPWYLALNPQGKAPVLSTPDGAVFESAAICRYLATIGTNPALYPLPSLGGGIVRAQVDAWVDWSAGLDAITSSLVYPIVGMRPPDADFWTAPKRLDLLLTPLEAHLAQRTWLVGEAITLADVVVTAQMFSLYLTVFDDDLRAKYPGVCRLLSSVFNHPTSVPLFNGTIPTPPAKRYPQAVAPRPDAFGSRPDPIAPHAVVLGQPWTGARVRSCFTEFFETKGHTHWPSSAVVPHNDPTLLFTNAGMNQYKPIFLGTVDPNSEMGKLKRACNSQKCIRAGGKHNDLDDVGKDVYHHTFFEMLGNWSFGDYFKAEAIAWAWELLTVVYKLPGERLYATYFEGDAKQGLPVDVEARDIWLKYLPAERVLPFGTKENFWEMGDQGPCGPCTEIHFDRIGGRDASSRVNCEPGDPDVLEIWNNVFIQFNREADGSLRKLPANSVDTGMGLERVTSVLQGKMSNYATDLFTPIFDDIQRITGARDYTDKIGKEDSDGVDMAYRVVADHIRTLSFSIADGARPGNEGRDFVLRRILRRAVRYGRETLHAKEGFFAQLVDVVVRHFSPAFPELLTARDIIYDTIREEETSFSRTLVKGTERFKKAAAAAQGGVVSGQDVFLLWDTFGFPADLTQLMAEEVGLTIDTAGFEAAMEEARLKSKAGGKRAAGVGLKFEAEATGWLNAHTIPHTNDLPKYEAKDVSAKVLAILSSSGYVDSTAGAEGPFGLVLDTTSFYAESGGQVNDLGSVSGDSGASFAVTDCQVAAGYVLHIGEVTGSVAVGQSVTTHVDYERRRLVVPNHTMTHVLNFALRKVLGDHIDQKGSIVLPDKLRFDFSNNGVIEADKLAAVEQICRDSVAAKQAVSSKEVSLALAKQINGLRAVFGEVYPDPVRVVCVGRSVDELLASPALESNRDYSVEFCGGTHVANTADSHAFALISEEGIAKGIRRIVAVTGPEAVKAIAEGERLRSQLVAAQALPIDGPAVEKAAVALKQVIDIAVVPAAAKAALRDELLVLTKKIFEQQKLAAGANRTRATAAAVAEADAAVAAGRTFVVAKLDVAVDAKALNEVLFSIVSKHAGVAALLVCPDAEKGKVLISAVVPEPLLAKIKANEWTSAVLALVGGKGGGKPNAAQGQGTDVSGVAKALEVATSFATQKLA